MKNKWKISWTKTPCDFANINGDKVKKIMAAGDCVFWQYPAGVISKGVEVVK